MNYLQIEELNANGNEELNANGNEELNANGHTIIQIKMRRYFLFLGVCKIYIAKNF